jgi:hypothetical protein
MTPEDNRARMRKALEERGFFQQQPDPMAFAPVPRAAPMQPPPPRDDDWTLEKAFRPETLRRVAENEGRFWGGLAKDVGGALSRTFEPVGDFMESAVERGRQMSDVHHRYQPQIDAVNARTAALRFEEHQARNAGRARLGALVDAQQAEMPAMRADLMDRFSPPTVQHTMRAPQDMDDDELMAELERERARAGVR